MLKTHFTRKNFIAISMVFFYCLMVLITAIAIDGNNPFFAKNNPIQLMAASMFELSDEAGAVVNGVPCGSLPAYFLIILFCIYVLLCTASIIYEVRLAKYYDEKPTSRKWLITYGVTFLICGALWIGLSMVSQLSGKPPYFYYIGNCFLYLWESIVLGLIYYVIVVGLIFNVCLLVTNIKNIDKPFRFFNNSKELKKEEEEDRREEAFALEQGKLAESFGEGGSSTVASAAAAVASGPVSSMDSSDSSSSPLKDKERVFPGLCSIDYGYMTASDTTFDDNLTLKEIALRFRNYLAKNEGLYFTQEVIDEFLAGLASSRLIILEGLSGTGKSSLARYFSEFISEKSYFEAVQATWRDRTSLLGFYNDFSRTYNETEFLKRLYEYSYKPKHINVMVLDELNISRVEYYFADFLSVLEYPQDSWKIKIMQFPYDFEAPEHLEDGVLSIPSNTYFIGTANKDESTFTITDKVYDRAITISFDDRNDPFEVKGDSDKITLSYPHLQELFEEAKSETKNQMSEEDYQKLKELTDFTYDLFDITFGNRILAQMVSFVPVYVSCGGNKEDAIDFLFSRKVVAKLEGRFEDYVKQGLLDLKKLIDKNYGKDSFSKTRSQIDKYLRKLA